MASVRVDHVEIPATDPEASARFYEARATFGDPAGNEIGLYESAK